MGIIVLWAQPAFAAATMTVSPTSGAAGSSFTVSGTECVDGEDGGVGGSAVGRDANANSNLEESEVLDADFAAANSSGAWNVTLAVPAGTATGALLVEGACFTYYSGSDFDYPDASFTVTGAPSSTLTVSDNTVAPGDKITIQGNGFKPGSSAQAVLFSDPVVLGSAVADSGGVVRLTVTIPAGTTPGTHRIELQGVDNTGAARVLSASLTVTGATLPRTGSGIPLRAVAFVGSFTICAGVAVVAARRMRDDPHWPI